MRMSDINPHIRYAATHYKFFDKNFDSMCYDCRFFFVEEGTGTIIANGRSYSFSENTAIFLPPGTKYHLYKHKNSHKFTMTVVNFDLINDYCYLAISLGTASEHNFSPEKLITYELPEAFSTILVKQVSGLTELLHKCTQEFSNQNSFYRESASALLKLCLMEFQRNQTHDSRISKITPVLNFIHSNYNNTTLTNEYIATTFNYNTGYLSQMMKDYTGKSLHQYLISYRLKMAKENLITTDDSINTIAWKSGFQSTSYFSKTFKEQIGMTPKQYRTAYDPSRN